MASVDVLKVFVASPSDVADERGHVEEVLNELNHSLAPDLGITLQSMRWEADTFPGYGSDAQAVINAQVGEMAQYALFVGIMWNRLGSPTQRAASGTVEEFERAADALKRHGRPEIWFYFRDAAALLTTAQQLAQRKGVVEFREKLEAGGFVRAYEEPLKFKDMFRTHLTQWLLQRKHGGAGSAAQEPPPQPAALDEASLNRVLVQLTQLLERHEERSTEGYAQIFKPAMDQFEQVHQDYVRTLTAYRRLLQNRHLALDLQHPVFARIAADSYRSSAMRAKVMAMRQYTADPVLGRFALRLSGYLIDQFELPNVLVHGARPTPNAPRRELENGLTALLGRTLPEDQKRHEAVALVDKLMQILMAGYQLVADEQIRVKAAMLGMALPQKPLSALDAMNLPYEDRLLQRQRDSSR